MKIMMVVRNRHNFYMCSRRTLSHGVGTLVFWCFYILENDPHELVNLANDPEHQKALAHHRDILSTWIKVTGDKGQVVESDIGLLATMKRWGNLCVNPEYDRVRDKYKEWKDSQQGSSKAKKKVSSK